MPRRQRVRKSSAFRGLSGHPIVNIDPASARGVADAIANSVLPGTRSSYATAIDNYLRFCELRAIQPWPVDVIWFCAWLLMLARNIKHTSLKSYAAGLRYGQLLEGFHWNMTWNGRVRAVLRFIQRKYPVPKARNKVPISVALMKTIFPFIKGWPHPHLMDADDVVMVAASLTATGAFLRGGEFLRYNKSGRPLLQRKHVVIQLVAKSEAVVVHIRQPKTSWWLDEVLVPCYANDADSNFCPVFWNKALRSLFSPPLSPLDPAFPRPNRSAITRDFIVHRLEKLMVVAGISCLDGSGAPVKIFAASFRAGGVRTAKDAGMAESMIMALGRWKSSAWMHYLIHTPLDFKSMATAMWAVQAPLAARAEGLRVGVCETQAEFSSDTMEVENVQELVERKLNAEPLGEIEIPIGQPSPIGQPIVTPEVPVAPIGQVESAPLLPIGLSPLVVESRPPIRPGVVPLSVLP